MTVMELSKKTVEEMIRYGMSEVCSWRMYANVFKPIIHAHQEKERDDFDEDVVADYRKHIGARYVAGEINEASYRDFMRGVDRLTTMHRTGKLVWTGPRNTSKYQLNTFFEAVLEQYLNNGDFGVKGRSDAMWIGKKYFAWFIGEKFDDFTNVSAPEVQRFIIACAKQMRTSSLVNVKLYMRKLHVFLYNQGYQKSDFKDLFSFRVLREQKIYAAADPDEVYKVLKSIDRTFTIGKRNYAMISQFLPETY